MGEISDMMLDGTLCQVCGEYIWCEDYGYPQTCQGCLDHDEGEEEIDHSFTEEIVCPYCGYEHSDSFEMQDSGKMKCSECKKEFTYEREVEVTYSTEKIEEDAR